MHSSRNTKTQKPWFPQGHSVSESTDDPHTLPLSPGLKLLELMTPVSFEGGGHPEWRQEWDRMASHSWPSVFQELHFAQKHLAERDLQQDHITLDYFCLLWDPLKICLVLSFPPVPSELWSTAGKGPNMGNGSAVDWRAYKAACEHIPSLGHASSRGKEGWGLCIAESQGKSWFSGKAGGCFGNN